MIRIKDLYIYPVKSLGGIRVTSVELTDRGFRHDRRWMLVDENNSCLTQREYPVMALLQTEIDSNGIRVFHKDKPDTTIVIPFLPATRDSLLVTIWDDICIAKRVSDETDRWFSERLGANCKLVYMADESLRKVDPQYAIDEKDITSFADAYPFLIISKESLDDLNARLPQPLPMNRFRPNIVCEGTEAYLEDRMEEFVINGIRFFGVKLCARCMITTINQDTSAKNKEPLKSLASYRSSNNKIYFGQNVVHSQTGLISVGDTIEIIKRKAAPDFQQEVADNYPD